MHILEVLTIYRCQRGQLQRPDTSATSMWRKHIWEKSSSLSLKSLPLEVRSSQWNDLSNRRTREPRTWRILSSNRLGDDYGEEVNKPHQRQYVEPVHDQTRDDMKTEWLSSADRRRRTQKTGLRK